MILIRRHKWTSYISAMLVLAFVVTLSPLSVWAADMGQAPAKVLLALGEGRILPAEIANAASEATQAIKVGYALGMNKVVLAQIVSLRVSNNPRQVQVVLAGSMYDVAANYDEQADEPVASPEAERSFSVVGVSTARADYRGSDRLLVREALRDAAGQASQVLEGKTLAQVQAERAQPKKKKSGWRGLGYLLGLGVLVALVASSGGGGGGPSPAAAPPIPDRVEIEPNAIRLFWTPPSGTTLTLLRYQIERSINGLPWERIDGGLADAGRTSWPDFDVSAGNTYQYRIRAVYTNMAYSEWKLFTAVLFNPI